MRALILAAGPGSRMLPHTEHRPKCLLKVGGHCILDYQIAALRHCGIQDIAIVVGYLADRIKEHVSVPVTFIENREYASTGSSYSLWLARDFIQDGFVHLNSDLIFHPDLLTALLAAPDPNAVIVDRQVNPTGDMQKAAMEGSRIVRMGKHIPADMAAAEVVGPAKFCPSGARRIAEYLERLASAGDRNRWAYEIFGLLAPEIGFTGIDNPGCFWAEIDTPADVVEASQRIPHVLMEFVDGRISTVPPVERRRRPTIDQQPILYLDYLLNSRFSALVGDLPEVEVPIREVLGRNKEEFLGRISELGLSSLSAVDLHGALQQEVVKIDATLSKVYGRESVTSPDALAGIVEQVLDVCPSDLRTGFCLREAAAIELLERHPPVNMIDALSYRSISALIDGEGALAALALTRTTEQPEWQARYKALLGCRTADDFEARPIQCVVVDSNRYRAVFMNSKQSPKLWRVTHNKEAGIVVCLTLDDPLRFRAPVLQYVLVFMHYFFETAYASRYYQLIAETDPAGLGQEVVKTIYTHRDKLSFFYSNVYSENLFWERAIDLLARVFPGPEIEWFRATTAHGEYCESTGIQNIIVSLNLIDHLWNMNFLGHAGMETFQHDSIYFLYHFRGALWQKVVNQITGLGDEMDEMIVRNLGCGDTTLTHRLLAELPRAAGV